MAGNMYDWVDMANANPLLGECSHKCKYCYVEKLKKRSKVLRERYSGAIRLDEKLLKKKFRNGTRFLCSCNDLFAENVPDGYISLILEWAASQENVRWVVQTKNPKRMQKWMEVYKVPNLHKHNSTFVWGATIETNRKTQSPFVDSHISDAPNPADRVIKGLNFITLEPMLDFDLRELVEILSFADPEFINIGADSGNNHLPEPPPEKIKDLVQMCGDLDIEIRKKSNLERIMKKPKPKIREIDPGNDEIRERILIGWLKSAAETAENLAGPEKNDYNDLMRYIARGCKKSVKAIEREVEK
jgi:protein gp37